MPFGIDLGTTNSSIAWADEQGEVWSLSVRSGREPFDAVIRTMVFDPLGVPVIGELAMQERFRRTAPLLASFKSKLDKQRLRRDIRERVGRGTRYNPQTQAEESDDTYAMRPLYDDFRREEVVGAAACMLRRLLTSDDIDREGLTIALPGAPRGVLSRFLRGVSSTSPTSQVTTPAVPSARLLESLRQGDSTDRDRLYVGVPVTFGPTARKRLLGALGQTGLFGPAPGCYRQILATCRFVYEPLALASDVLPLGLERILIVDLGGGTLDLALLEIDTDGDGKRVKQLGLGGLGWAGDRLSDCFTAALRDSDPRLKRLLEEAERRGPYDYLLATSALTKAKIDLSRQQSTTLLLDEYQRDVTRSEFESAIADPTQEIVTAVDTCITQAGLNCAEVTRVILTGGSSLIPSIQSRLRACFPHLDEFAFEAQFAGDTNAERRALTGVSRGLARFAYIESFEGGSACNWDVWSPSTSSGCVLSSEGPRTSLTRAPLLRCAFQSKPA